MDNQTNLEIPLDLPDDELAKWEQQADGNRFLVPNLQPLPLQDLILDESSRNETTKSQNPKGIRSTALVESGSLVAASSVPDIPCPSGRESNDWSGRKFGKYLLRKKLAEGGSGSVYRAEQMGEIRRPAAIKVLNATFSPTGKRWVGEAQALASLDHVNIVRIIDVGITEDGIRFLVMPLIDGVRSDEWAGLPCKRESPGRFQDMSAHSTCGASGDVQDGCSNPVAASLKAQPDVSIRETKPPESLAPNYWQLLLDQCCPPPAIVAMMLEVAKAIAYAHSRGILHRDIKPSNILVSAAGHPTVTDFGLALHIKPLAEFGSTQTGVLIGSLGFLAPEQLKWAKDSADPRLDVYGFGATLYYLLSGQPPIRIESFSQAIDDLVNRRPPRLAQRNPRVSRDLDFVVQKCLEKIPEDRYGSMEAVATDLNRYLLGLPLVGQRVSTWKRLVRWCQNEPRMAVSILGAALILIGISAALAWLWRSSELNRQKVQTNLQTAIQIVQSEQEEASRYLPNVQGSAKYRIQRLKTAVGFLEQILQTNPDDAFAKRRLAVTHFLLGQVPLRHGREDEVMTSLQAALHLFQELAISFPADETLLFDIFHTKLAMGDYIPFGPHRIAAEKETLAVIEPLAARFPENADYADAYACQLCRVANSISNSYSSGEELGESDRLASRAVEVSMRISEQFPDKPNFLRHVVGGKRILSKNSMYRRDFLASKEIIASSLPYAELLFKKAPEYAENGQLLVLVLAQYACAELLNHNDQRANELRQQADKLNHHLLEIFPDYSAIVETADNINGIYEYGLSNRSR